MHAMKIAGGQKSSGAKKRPSPKTVRGQKTPQPEKSPVIIAFLRSQNEPVSPHDETAAARETAGNYPRH